MLAADFPQTNDTRDVLAAYENWLAQQGKPVFVPSKLPLNPKVMPLPADVGVFSVVLLRNITKDQAQAVQLVVGTASQTSSWGGPTTYRWPGNCTNPAIMLVQRADEEGFTLAFSLVYLPESDVKLILQRASDTAHLEHYQRLGLKPEQIQLLTFRYTEQREWEPVADVPKGVSA
jgi:hypothetical protein